MKTKIAHIIVGLGKGGAETTLYQLLKNRQNVNYEHKVISFGQSDYYSPFINQLGIKVTVINPLKSTMSFYKRVFREIEEYDVVCCWMYHASYVGIKIKKKLKSKKVIWFIRHSNLDRKLNSKLTLYLIKRCAKKSSIIDCIAYNGEQSRIIHEKIGFDRSKGIVINNGCDCNYFCFDPSARNLLCKSLKIGEDAVILLSVTKDTPIKDIPTFIKAFSIIHKQIANAKAVLCGFGVDSKNQNLVKMFEKKHLKLGSDFFLLGQREDMPFLFSSCDCYVLHSAGEAFPNSLVQAMSCKCLCVSTDVGDARLILGKKEYIVKPNDASELSSKIIEVINLKDSEKRIIKNENRERILKNYDINEIVLNYETVMSTDF